MSLLFFFEVVLASWWVKGSLNRNGSKNLGGPNTDGLRLKSQTSLDDLWSWSVGFSLFWINGPFFFLFWKG